MGAIPKPTAIVLLSGGIDSLLVADVMREQYECIALIFEYGNPAVERECAYWLADYLHMPTLLCRIPSMGGVGEANYFPARNTIFLAHALHFAEARGLHRIVIGANADDAAEYPDCRCSYFEAWQLIAHLGTRVGVESHGKQAPKILTPLIELTKADIIRDALQRKLPMQQTCSCYRPRDKTPCGECAACRRKHQAMRMLGLPCEDEPIALTWKKTEAVSNGAH